MTDSTNNNNNSTSTSSGWTRLVQSVQSNIAKKQEEAREAREAKAAGKIYKDGQYVFYLLDEEEKELNQNNALLQKQESITLEQKEEREVADREYYDLLQVSTSADTSTIKRAYYKVARKCHPDKCPDDPDAHCKFQELGHAYQILSNESTRALYDKHGKTDSSNSSQNEVDPMVFFNIMFGSTIVESYIGELWLAQQTDTMMNESMMDRDSLEKMTEQERNEILKEQMKQSSETNKVKQAKREVKIAQFLRDRIATYTPDTVGEYTESCREEAIKIVAGAFGGLYCVTIGFSLQIAAEEYLGFETTFLGMGGHFARSRKNASGFANNMKLLGAGIRAASAGSKAMREAQELERAAEEQGDDAALQEAQEKIMAETLDESLPTFLEFAWAINKRDIQSTLKNACQKLFDDASVPKEMRMQRAQAVQILGREFQSVGRKEAASNNSHFQAEDIKARVAVATMATMAKAQGQEVTEEDQQEMMEQAKQMSMDAKANAGGAGVDEQSAETGGGAEGVGAANEANKTEP